MSPVWSPDGRQIAFLRFDGVAGRLHVTSALTASEVKLSALPPVPDRILDRRRGAEHRLVSGMA